jgi:hypothetical protein
MALVVSLVNVQVLTDPLGLCRYFRVDFSILVGKIWFGGTFRSSPYTKLGKNLL